SSPRPHATGALSTNGHDLHLLVRRLDPQCRAQAASLAITHAQLACAYPTAPSTASGAGAQIAPAPAPVPAAAPGGAAAAAAANQPQSLSAFKAGQRRLVADAARERSLQLRRVGAI